MNSSVFVSGIALWVLLACTITVMSAIIILGCVHIKVLKENYELSFKNEQLRNELSSVKYARYRHTFKAPEIEDV